MQDLRLVLRPRHLRPPPVKHVGQAGGQQCRATLEEQGQQLGGLDVRVHWDLQVWIGAGEVGTHRNKTGKACATLESKGNGSGA